MKRLIKAGGIAICCALFSSITLAQSFSLSTSETTSNDGNFTLSWSGVYGMSAFPIFKDGEHVATVGGGQYSYTFDGVVDGTYTFRVEGCNSYGCQDLTKNNQAVSNNVSVNVNGPVAALNVRRHTSVSSISTSRVHAIFNDATEALSELQGSGDVACRVRMTLAGTVGTYSAGNGEINSEDDMNDLQAGVNIVNEINWCGTLSTNIIGCAPRPGDSMAVVRHTSNQEGILWAHEYGHNVGLEHRNNTNAIMFATIGLREQVNNLECGEYEDGI